MTLETAWLSAVSPIFQEEDFGWDSGKWCIFRHANLIDTAWKVVNAAVEDSRFALAKCSSAVGAPAHADVYVICVYCHNSRDREALMRVREVLRELGFVEDLGYKADHATMMGVYDTPVEWLYRF